MLLEALLMLSKVLLSFLILLTPASANEQNLDCTHPTTLYEISSCWDARLEEMKHQLSAELSPEVVERFDRSIVDLCKSIHHPERVGTAHIYPLITRSCVEKIFEVALDEITD